MQISEKVQAYKNKYERICVINRHITNLENRINELKKCARISFKDWHEKELDKICNLDTFIDEEQLVKDITVLTIEVYQKKIDELKKEAENF